eukprot:2160872-Prorocentrum_lima.AAC.1
MAPRPVAKRWATPTVRAAAAPEVAPVAPAAMAPAQQDPPAHQQAGTAPLQLLAQHPVPPPPRRARATAGR